jgi:hypothetical protein
MSNYNMNIENDKMTLTKTPISKPNLFQATNLADDSRMGRGALLN